MSNISKRLADLSPEAKRALLGQLLRKKATDNQSKADQMVSTADSSAAINVTDLNAEAVLDPNICSEAAPVEHVAEPSHIFLTGATGYLGAFLLYELLQQTKADIYCLVRSPNAEEGKQRLQGNLESYSLWNEGLGSRIIPVTGDLSKPYLGLSAEQFQMMASQIDVFYHSGALVSWIQPYHALKATNVSGTQEVLRLASKIKLKPVHFTSTIAVFPFGSHKVFREEDNLDHSEGLIGGYPQSKWVAEKLVTIARSRGLPVCIYRPGIITGHSQTGVCNRDNLMYRVIKGFIQLASAADVDRMVDMTPVNYVSRAIVHLSKQPDSLGKVFHLTNPQPLHMSKLLDWIQSFGYPLRRIPYDTWKRELFNLAERFQENALYPFWAVLADLEEHQTIVPQSDCRNTLNGLTGTSIVCPPVDAELLGTYFSYYFRSGFLDAPQR
ncbi:MAG: thioester reductase domain-containing protein [Dehalococcoidia bacterium]